MKISSLCILQGMQYNVTSKASGHLTLDWFNFFFSISLVQQRTPGKLEVNVASKTTFSSIANNSWATNNWESIANFGTDISAFSHKDWICCNKDGPRRERPRHFYHADEGTRFLATVSNDNMWEQYDHEMKGKNSSPRLRTPLRGKIWPRNERKEK